LLNLANGLGDTPEAMGYQRRAIELWSRLVFEYPDRPAYREHLVLSRTNLAISLLRLRRSQEIEEVIRPALAPAEALASDLPKVPAYRASLAKAFRVLSAALLNTRRYAEAEEPTWRAKDILEKLVSDYPDVPGFQKELREHVPMMSRVADYLSFAPADRGRNPARALDLARKAAELRPDDLMALQSLGWALYRAGDWTGSIDSLMKSMGGKPEKGDLCQWLVLAMDYWNQGDRDRARDLFARADEHFERYVSGLDRRWQKGEAVHPEPGLLRGIRAEAAALLGVTTPEIGRKP
jgi:tetratricopeptide (TPR) repeat protein